MSKETRKPSFTPDIVVVPESTSWTAPSTDARPTRMTRMKAGAESAVDVVTYPASLAMMLVLFPVAAVANWWRE